MHIRFLAIIAIVLALIIAGLITAHFVIPLKPAGPAAPAQPMSGEDRKIEEQGDYYHIEAVSPGKTPLSASANAAAVASMEGFVTATIADFKRDSGLMTLTQEDIEMQGLGGDRKYALDISYKTYSSPSTVSYVFAIYEDTLGAHPNAYYRTFTFDVTTGTELLISDLFTSDVYLEALSSGSRTQIANRLGAENTVTEYLESGTTPDAPNFQFFYLDGNDLVIVFPPYQVGPWAIGTQEARFPRTDFDLIKPEYR